MRVIDRDRIEERNLSTQPYYSSDVGAFKARILAASIYRALGIEVDARADELNSHNCAKLLRNSGLVIDTFDNSPSRSAVKLHCQSTDVPCLHVGLAADYAEVIWNEHYQVPGPANDDVCDYPLARNLAMLATAVACEVVVRYAVSGERISYTITMADFAIRPSYQMPTPRD